MDPQLKRVHVPESPTGIAMDKSGLFVKKINSGLVLAHDT